MSDDESVPQVANCLRATHFVCAPISPRWTCPRFERANVDSLAWPLVQENLVADVERRSYLTGSNEERTCLVHMFASLACARGSAISRSRHSLKSWRLVFSRSAHREPRVLKDLASGLRVRVFDLRQKRMGTFRYRAGTVGDA